MKAGNVPEWKKYHPSRFVKTNPIKYPKFKQPEWKGEQNLLDKTILVYDEPGYGFGDVILALGHVMRLTNLAHKVIFVVRDELYDLFCINNHGIEIVKKSSGYSDLKFDYHIPSMSIATALNLNIENISVGGGYIKADKELSKEYKKKYFNNNKLKIGFAYLGRKGGELNKNIPFESILNLDSLKNAQLYCFTKDISDKEFKAFKKMKL